MAFSCPLIVLCRSNENSIMCLKAQRCGRRSMLTVEYRSTRSIHGREKQIKIM